MLRPSLWGNLSSNSSTVLRGVVSHSTDHSVTACSLTTLLHCLPWVVGYTLHADFWMPIMLQSFFYFVMTCLNNFDLILLFFSVSTAYFFFLSLCTSFVMCFAIYIYIYIRKIRTQTIKQSWWMHKSFVERSPVIFEVLKTEQIWGLVKNPKLGRLVLIWLCVIATESWLHTTLYHAYPLCLINFTV